MASALTLRDWFIKHDMRFGVSLLTMDPEDQGKAICERYEFDQTEVRRVYLEKGEDAGNTNLLALLNDYIGESSEK